MWQGKYFQSKRIGWTCLTFTRNYKKDTFDRNRDKSVLAGKQEYIYGVEGDEEHGMRDVHGAEWWKIISLFEIWYEANQHEKHCSESG